MASTVAPKRRRGSGLLTFIVACFLAGLAWFAAQVGFKGVLALGLGLSFAVAVITFSKRNDMILVLGVGASAALMHKTFTSLEEISSGPPSIYVNTFDIMLFVLWMSWFVTDPWGLIDDVRKAFRRPVMWLPVIAFTLLLPSVAAAQNTTLAGAEVVRMMSMFLVFVFFAVRIQTKRQVLLVLGALMLVAVGEAVIVAGQYVTRSALGLSIFGTPSILHNRFDGIAFARPFGTMAHPVFMGAYVGPLGLLAFSLAVNLRDRRIKWAALAIAALAISPLLLASARSASLAVVVSFVVLCIWLLVTGRLPGATAGWWILGVLTLAVIASPYLIELWNNNFRTEHFGLEWESRTELNDIAVAMFEDRPFWGHGLNNFEQVMPRYDEFGLIFADNPVHNIYLLYLAESGIIGTLGMLTFGVGITAVAVRLSRSKDRLLSAVGFAGAAIFLFWAVEEMLVFSLRQDHPRQLLFILSGLIVACDRMAATRRKATPTTVDVTSNGSGPGPGANGNGSASNGHRPYRNGQGAHTNGSHPKQNGQRRVGVSTAARATAVAILASILTLVPGAGSALAQDDTTPVPSTDPGLEVPRDALNPGNGDPIFGSQEPTPPDAPVEPEPEDQVFGNPQPGVPIVPPDDDTFVLPFPVVPRNEVVSGTTPSDAGMAIVLTAIDRTDGIRRIYTLAPGSVTPVQVSPEDGRQYSWASWAFNGNKIVFTARTGDPGQPENIYWMNADGSQLELLLELPFRSGQPKVNEDGTVLMFTGVIPGTSFTRLFGWDMATGTAWNISAASDNGFLDSDPSFSPDDEHIVFIDSELPGGGGVVPGEIGLIRASGQERQRLTSNGDYDTDPAITADLRHVVSSRYVGDGTPDDPNSDNPFQARLDDFRIIEVDTLSGAETELTQGLGCFIVPVDFSCTPDQGSSYLPLYTPDESRIGYMSVLSQRRTCICTIDRDGTDPRIRFESDALSLGWFDWIEPGPIPPTAILDPVPPTVLPDGLEPQFDFPVVDPDDVPVGSHPSEASLDIVFVGQSRNDNVRRLYLLEAGSDQPIQISPEDGRDYDSPTFAFGSTKVVFTVRSGSGFSEIWWMDRDGSNIAPLLTEEVDLRSPEISPDGTTLVFGSSGNVFGWDLATGFVFNASAAAEQDGVIDTDPSFGGTSDEIVVTSRGDLVVMSPSGSEREQLTLNGRADTSPALSSTGASLLSSRYVPGILPPGGSVDGFAVIRRDRVSEVERILTLGLGCHRVPSQFSCMPDQASSFHPRFSPDDVRAGFVGILSTNTTCICTASVDGGATLARFRSTELALGDWDWSADTGVPSTAVLTPTHPDDQVSLVDFPVILASDLPTGATTALDVVFTARSRSDNLSRIYLLRSGAVEPVQVSPEDGRTYGWATFAHGTQKIVYTVLDDDGVSSIWWMNANGSAPSELVRAPNGVTRPRMTPDGRTLLFSAFLGDTAFTQIFSLDLETGWVENLSAREGESNVFDTAPALNGFGTRLAIAADGNPVVLGLDGTGRRTVIDGEFRFADPALNIDANQMVVAELVEEAVEGTGELDRWRTVILSTQGGQGRVLSQADSCERVPATYVCRPGQGTGLSPLFSPNDQRVGFVSTLSSTTMCICTVATDGSDGRAGFVSESLVIDSFDWSDPAGVPSTAVLEPANPDTLLRNLLITFVEDGEAGLMQTRADRFIEHIIETTGLVPTDAAASADGETIVFSADVITDGGFPLITAADIVAERQIHYTIDIKQAATRDLPEERADVSNSQIFVVASDGSGLRQLTTPRTEDWRDAMLTDDRRGNVLPDISPDGRYVLFTNISTTSEESFILRYDLFTGEILSLTNATQGALPAHDSDPKWSPDGRRVAFVADSGGVPEVWVMDADGYNALAVSDGVEGRFPAWSADGGSLSFAIGDTLMVLDLATGEQRPFVQIDGASISRSAWSPDGRFVAYVVIGADGLSDVHIRSVDGATDLTVRTVATGELGVDW